MVTLSCDTIFGRPVVPEVKSVTCHDGGVALRSFESSSIELNVGNFTENGLLILATVFSSVIAITSASVNSPSMSVMFSPVSIDTMMLLKM